MTEKRYAVYLSDVSPMDGRWDEKKRDNIQLGILYSGTDYSAYTSRLDSCSSYLYFGLKPCGDGSENLVLKESNFCRVCFCPICQWRRSMRWRAKTFKILPQLTEQYPKSRFLLLTLTVRNPHISELRETLSNMQLAWKRLVSRKEWKLVQGHVRSLEVTRQCENDDKSRLIDYAHPHYHVLLMVKPDYFNASYISQKKWVELWQECLQVDYLPGARVSAIKIPKDSTDEQVKQIISKNILEVIKYTTKSSELLVENSNLSQMSNKQWLVELTKQLHKTKKISTGGIFKDYYKELEDSIDNNLININDELEEEEVKDTYKVRADWEILSGRYEIQ